MEVGTDLTWHALRTGYVNTHGRVRTTLLGRVYYEATPEVLESENMLRIASWGDFEPCWQVCPSSRLCAHVRVCMRERERAAHVMRACLAVRGLV